MLAAFRAPGAFQNPTKLPLVVSTARDADYLLGQLRVRPEHDRVQSCAIALRSPAYERSYLNIHQIFTSKLVSHTRRAAPSSTRCRRDFGCSALPPCRRHRGAARPPTLQRSSTSSYSRRLRCRQSPRRPHPRSRSRPSPRRRRPSPRCHQVTAITTRFSSTASRLR